MKLRGLRQARQRVGMSLGQLAEATGLRRETVTRLEHCQEEPQPYALHRLEMALDCSAADLAHGPGGSLATTSGGPYVAHVGAREHAHSASH
ncbi:MAG TPA: helix-turn-helix transcriptional regulator [Ktedonobacterales bacterium]